MGIGRGRVDIIVDVKGNKGMTREEGDKKG